MQCFLTLGTRDQYLPYITIRQNRYLSVVIKYTFFGALWVFRDVTKTRNGKRGTGNGERRTSAGNGKIKKWEQNRELAMKLLIGIGVKISFFSPFFHYVIPRACSRSPLPPFPVLITLAAKKKNSGRIVLQTPTKEELLRSNARQFALSLPLRIHF